tara:strand:- start:1659 stop:2048 length:390 start_codon:yes stop_codon:yes gene_type:complete
MASPFEQAWVLLKNEGEMPMQNNYPQDPPGMRPPPVEFPPPGMESTTPPELALRKPSNLVSPTGNLADIPLDERGIREMSPVPPARPPVRPELAAKLTPQTALETDPSNAEVRPVYNEIGRIIGFEDAR